MNQDEKDTHNNDVALTILERIKTSNRTTKQAGAVSLIHTNMHTNIHANIHTNTNTSTIPTTSDDSSNARLSSTPILTKSELVSIPFHFEPEGDTSVCADPDCIVFRQTVERVMKPRCNISVTVSCPFTFDSGEYLSTFYYRSSPWYLLMDFPIRKDSWQRALKSIKDSIVDDTKTPTRVDDNETMDRSTTTVTCGSLRVVIDKPTGRVVGWEQVVDDLRWRFSWCKQTRQITSLAVTNVAESSILCLEWNEQGQVTRVQNEQVVHVKSDMHNEYRPRSKTYPLIRTSQKCIELWSLVDPLKIRKIVE